MLPNKLENDKLTVGFARKANIFIAFNLSACRDPASAAIADCDHWHMRIRQMLAVVSNTRPFPVELLSFFHIELVELNANCEKQLWY